MESIELRALDFTEVGGQLKRAGGQIERFTTVIHNDYAGSFTGVGSLLYRVTVEAGDHAYLCVDAYTLAFDYFGVRVALYMGRERVLLATWMFSDARRSRLDPTEPAQCIRCLRPDCRDDECPGQSIKINEIPVADLCDAVVRWIRSELPDNAFRDRRPPA